MGFLKKFKDNFLRKKTNKKKETITEDTQEEASLLSSKKDEKSGVSWDNFEDDFTDLPSFEGVLKDVPSVNNKENKDRVEKTEDIQTESDPFAGYNGRECGR